ncbi:glutathione S-transferase [Pyxidicoccus fallax]|uniref:Glutathione S-transferase n=1 Tax=Pyxidicoccus fallax TaxID=394095 RepID=A0A848LX23_9BACT|nr:glutathione S-transferase [Pyxidicoccus fallax]NMO22181.1 glutathione S-transferase [Pyxidicoccus fallax]NPC84128.1 glutathione S-transferase [Pyxidicoccus fallax]
MSAELPLPRLSYFHARGLAEKIRLLLAEAGVEYEYRDLGLYDAKAKVKTPEFEAIKATGILAFDKVPLWEETDGFCVVQSKAVLRHIARTRNLFGANDREATACDMIIDSVEEVSARALGLTSLDPDQLSEQLPLVLGEELPNWLRMFERFIAKNHGGEGFFVGDRVSVADTMVFGMLEMLVDNGLMEVIESYPRLRAFFTRMQQRPNIARWLADPKRFPPVQLLNG